MVTNHSNISKLLTFAMAITGLVQPLQAQTAKKFTVNITEDGKANMVAYLPEQPSGRAIVDCPGGMERDNCSEAEGYHAVERTLALSKQLG